MDRGRGNGGEAQLFWLPVPLATYQLSFPSLTCLNGFVFPKPGPMSRVAAGAPSADVTWGCRGAGGQGGLRGLFVPPLVFGLCGANPRGSGLPGPGPAKLGASWAQICATPSSQHRQPTDLSRACTWGPARQIYRGRREMYFHVTLSRKVRGMLCWWVPFPFLKFRPVYT